MFFTRAPTETPTSARWVAALFMVYFSCLGYGFIMIEIPILQAFSLLLGYPVYSLTVVLFSMLFFSGLGSLLSSRFSSSPKIITGLLCVVMLVLLAFGYFMPGVIDAGLAAPLEQKILTVIVSLIPVGLLLGMPFPMCVKILDKHLHHLIPWGWAMNGIMSVTASVFVIYLSSHYGFAFSMSTGVAAYAVALVCMLLLHLGTRGGLSSSDT
jgi:hypothetical protein